MTEENQKIMKLAADFQRNRANDKLDQQCADKELELLCDQLNHE